MMKKKTIGIILACAMMFTSCGNTYSELPNQFCSYYDAAGYDVPDYSQVTTFNHDTNEVLITGNDDSFYKLKVCKNQKDAKDIYKHLEHTDNANFTVKHHKHDGKSYITMQDEDSCYTIFRYGSNILTCWSVKNESKKSEEIFYDFIDTLAD